MKTSINECFFSAGLFIVIALLSACSFKNDEPIRTKVEGSVFIVTQGRDNIKMGLVPVYLMSAHEMSVFANVLRELQENEMHQRQEKIQSLEADWMRLREERLKLEATARQHWTNHTNQLAEISRVALSKRPPLIEEAKRAKSDYAATMEKISDITREQAGKSAAGRELSTDRAEGHLQWCFSHLNKPAATPTDADGKFEIQAEGRGRFFVLATSERKTGNREETYYWAEELLAEGKPVKVMLSNHNMLEEQNRFFPRVHLGKSAATNFF